jgi:hypothetical protein
MMEATMTAPKRKGGKPNRKAPYVTVNIKASDEWKAWLDRLAKHCRTDVAKLIDGALVDYAKAKGFTEEAPER